jgi:hypothetical protein
MTDSSNAITLSPFSSIEQFNDSHKMADALSHSSFVPAKFRGNIANCIQALGIAARLRVDPLSVMNSLYEVHGKIGFSSKFLIATVNASGKFDPIRWKFEGKIGTDKWGARAYAKDRQSGDLLEGPLVTISMANEEGWSADGKTSTGKVIKSKWKTMPEMMLRYRSASFWISMFAGEYAMGMRTSEDLQDEVVEAEPAKVVNRSAPKTLDGVVEETEKHEQSLPPAKPFEGDEPDPREIMEGLAKEMYGSEWNKKIAELMERKGFRGGLQPNQCSEIVDMILADQDKGGDKK